MRKKNVVTVAIIVFISTLFLFADGFWPEMQNNSFRTGRAEIGGNINQPEILWRYYRGGSISPTGSAIDDNGNSYLSLRGSMRAFDSSLDMLWETVNFGAGRIFTITDLDNSGENEIIVSGREGIYVVSAMTGTVLAKLDTETQWFVKVADLNNDGYQEVIVRGNWGVMELKAYRFAEGASNPELLWEIYENIPEWGFEITLGDLNDNGRKEMIMDRMSGGLISVFDAEDGTFLLDRPRVLSGKYAYGINLIINVDDDPQNKFIFTGNRSTTGSNGSYSISVYDFVKDEIQWQYEYGRNTINKGFRMVPGSVGDFNGDGVIDIVVSVFNNTLEGDADLDGVNAPDIWTTLIYRGDNGQLQARLDNTYLEGVADLNGDGNKEFILRAAPDSSKKLREYSKISLYRFADDDFQHIWSKDKVKTVKVMPEDREEIGVVYVTDIPATVPVGDGHGIVFIEDINRDGVGDRILSMSGTGATPAIKDVSYIVDGKSYGFIDATDESIYLSGNDGYIHIFQRGTTLSNERKIATGNYNGDSLFINSSAGGRILTTLSTHSHVLLDVQGASSVSDPQVVWSQINQYGQPLFAFDSNGNGRHEFVSLYTDSEGYTDIYLHGSNGGLIWGWTVGKIVTNPANFITGDFDGDGFKDIAFTFTSEEEGAMVYALRGLDGTIVGSFDSTANTSDYHNFSLVLAGDINDNTTDDLFLAHSFDVEVIDGGGLVKVSDFKALSWSYNPFAFDFMGDGGIYLFANQRRDGRKQMFDVSGNVIWTMDTSAELDSQYEYSTPYPGISKIDEDEGFDIVLGGKFGDVSAYSGSDGSVLWRRCLINGESTDISVSVIPTSTLCGGTTLSNIVTGDVTGDGNEEFVVGDKLGNLYVIHSSDGSLVWTMKFDGAIGNPILADVTGDGKIEIVAGVGDGYLYAIGQRVAVPAPSFVRDVTVIDGEIVSNTDIDEMVIGSSYGGLWQAVAGAAKYQVKLTDQDDTVLRETMVTGANQIIFDSLEVEVGDILYLSVKSIDSGGYSSDWTKSDGVVIEDIETEETDDIETGDEDFETGETDDFETEDDDFETEDFETEDFETDDFETDETEDFETEDDDFETGDFETDDFETDETDEEGDKDETGEPIDDDIEVKKKGGGCGCSIVG